MARPPKENRAEVKSTMVALKLTPTERAKLTQLVEARAQELHELTGQRIEVNASTYLRWLMERDAKARGLNEEASVSPAKKQRHSTRKTQRVAPKPKVRQKNTSP